MTTFDAERNRPTSAPRNAICVCTDRNMLVPALFVADAALSKEFLSPNRYDVIVFSQTSEVTGDHLAWMQQRGIIFRDDMDMSRLLDAKKFSGRLTAATLMKLQLAEHLSGEYEKLLYLDCDISIHDAVGSIFSLDTGNFELAAVASGRILIDLPPEKQRETIEHFRALGMSEPFRYFNSGVLYIDVKKWNQTKLGERAMAFIRQNPELCGLPDEDSLNAILDGEIAELSPIWNARPPEKRREKVKASTPAVIYHYAGPDKPWRRYGYRKRLFPDLSTYRLYEAYLRDTPWSDWLDKQWGAQDFFESIRWELKRISRKLRGKSGKLSAVQRKALSAATHRYLTETKFADVEQGIVDRRDGNFALAKSHEGNPV